MVSSIGPANLAAVRAALESGLMPNAQYVYTDGRSPLHMAAHRGSTEVCEFLISRGGDVHARDRHENTPLLGAASGGNVDTCRCLLSHGADVNSAGNGTAPLWHAARGGFVDVCELLLLGGADVHALNRRGSTALAVACSNGRLAVSALLVSKGAETKGDPLKPEASPLECAIRRGKLGGCSWLVEHGAGLHASAHFAAGRVLCDVAQWGTVDMAEWLLLHGFHVNAPHDNGGCALLAAARRGRVDMCQFLIEHGAS